MVIGKWTKCYVSYEYYFQNIQNFISQSIVNFFAGNGYPYDVYRKAFMVNNQKVDVSGFYIEDRKVVGALVDCYPNFEDTIYIPLESINKGNNKLEVVNGLTDKIVINRDTMPMNGWEYIRSKYFKYYCNKAGVKWFDYLRVELENTRLENIVAFCIYQYYVVGFIRRKEKIVNLDL